MDASRRPHLVPLGQTGWSLWRWVLLRSPGFAARRVLELGSDALASHVESERGAALTLREARSAVLDHCVRTSAGENPVVKKASRRVEKNKDVEDTGVAEVDALLGAYRAARQALATLQEQTIAVIRHERARTSDAIQAIARDPLFREAVTWQNRAAMREAVDALLEDSQDNSKTRQRQRLVAKYWQRYTVKNDSIGFFGPIAWADVDPAIDSIALEHGPSLVKRRVHRFEQWAIAALAEHVSAMPGVQTIFTPRRKPFSWLDGDTLMLGPPTPPRLLSKSDAYLMRAADGSARARDIARAAAASPDESGLATVDDAYAALAQLGKFGFLSWGVEIPSDVDDAAAWLQHELKQLDDEEVRHKALAPLERLIAGLDRVAAAAGDVEALDRSIEALEKDFQDITGLASKRGHGKVYASRQIFYEDCARDVQLTIGARVLDALAGPMSLLLTSARWYTYEIARRFREEVRVLHRALREKHLEAQIPLGTFLNATKVLFPGDGAAVPPFVASVKAELQQRWETLIGKDRLGGETGVVQLTTDELRERAMTVFAAPGPGWPRARYCSPDVMIAADSVADVARGNFLAVLGETHCGANTHLGRFAFRMHPEAEAVKAAWDADMQKPCVAPVPATTIRASHQPISDSDYHVELSWARSRRPRDHVHAAGDLVVEAVGERLLVRSRTGGVEYDIVEFMDQYLSNSAVDFHPFARKRHGSRVMIDGLLVNREQWHLDRSEFEQLLVGQDEIANVARWSRDLSLPRFVFGKVPHEPKPFFVDFASPILVDVLVRYLEKAESLSLSEMIPELDRLWLADANGETYTSELRFVVVDPAAWSAGQ